MRSPLGEEPDIRKYHFSERAKRIFTTGLSLGAVATIAAYGIATTEQHAQVTKTTIDKSIQRNAIQTDEVLGSPNSILSDNNDEVLRGLGRLEHDSQNRLFRGVMQFFEMPISSEESGSNENAETLKLIKYAKLKPLIVFEPNFEKQSVAELATAKYDKPTKDYYTNLYKKGVTDKTLGTFVLMPELLVGGWKDAQAGDYAAIVNHQTALLHSVFPTAKATSLIDLQSDESGPLISQLPALNRGTLHSIGIQAFSNQVPIDFTKNSNGILTARMNTYMDITLIEQISHAAGDLPIWINTGIPETDNDTHYTTEERKAVSQGIVSVVRQLQNRGIHVDYVNLFAQNKIKDEHINFDFNGQDAKTILPDLARSLKATGVGLYGFTADPS